MYVVGVGEQGKGIERKKQGSEWSSLVEILTKFCTFSGSQLLLK